MRKLITLALAALVCAACGTHESEEVLRERAAELCRYIPDHEVSAESKDYMTGEFFALLDTMFYRLPENDPMDNEWLYYFVTGNGGTIPDYTVADVEQTDATHAIATIHVRQMWEDSSFVQDCKVGVHRLYMEKVNGQWLMADFDEHKADCVQAIAANRREQAVRQAIRDYLVNEIGSQYMQGELCQSTLLLIRRTDSCVWGDFMVFWYNASGDTLQTVSGGNHAGRMTIRFDNGRPSVASFEQTGDGAGNDADARRIFGDNYDIYRYLQSHQDVREEERQKQLTEYVKSHNLPYRYYQDYGWPAVKLGR